MQLDEADFKNALGRRVRRLRLLAGATQDVLAERCGIYRTYLSRIEAGAANPTLVVLAALARALDARLCDLFCDQVTERQATPGMQPEGGGGASA